MRNQYKVALPFLMFNYLIILAMSVVAVLLFVAVVFNPALQDKWFALLWGGTVLFFLPPYGLQLVHTISLDESGLLVFKSLLFQKTYETADLRLITTNFGEGYFLNFEFRKVRVAVLNDVLNLSELIMKIRGFNPGVQTKGFQS